MNMDAEQSAGVVAESTGTSEPVSLTAEQQYQANEAADQAKVNELEAKITQEAANLDADRISLDEANAELAADQAASAQAAELAKASSDTAASEAPTVSVEAAVTDKLDSAVAQGIAAFDGFHEHSDKVTFFREISGVASALSTGSRDLLAKLISVL
jgi:membrane protein involved in colicin uptake